MKQLTNDDLLVDIKNAFNTFNTRILCIKQHSTSESVDFIAW